MPADRFWVQLQLLPAYPRIDADQACLPRCPPPPPVRQAVCELLSTAGAKLEGSPKGKARLDAAFRQLDRLSNASKVCRAGGCRAGLAGSVAAGWHACFRQLGRATLQPGCVLSCTCCFCFMASTPSSVTSTSTAPCPCPTHLPRAGVRLPHPLCDEGRAGAARAALGGAPRGLHGEQSALQAAGWLCALRGQPWLVGLVIGILWHAQQVAPPLQLHYELHARMPPASSSSGTLPLFAAAHC